MIRMLIMAVAVGSGGLAAWLTVAGEGGEAPVVAAAPPVSSEEVLVAAGVIEQGGTVTETSLRWQPWPAEAVGAGYVRRSARPNAHASFSGSVARSQFLPGEPIREDKLAPPGSGFMSALLPKGMRAVAVRISAENTAGGFVLPNDRVDVVHTVSRSAGEDAPPEGMSRTILTNIRVLAVDQTQNLDSANPNKVVVGRTATLELDPRQVETIAAAESSGTLSLALRSVADNESRTPDAGERSATVRVHRQGRIDAVKVSSWGPARSD